MLFSDFFSKFLLTRKKMLQKKKKNYVNIKYSEKAEKTLQKLMVIYFRDVENNVFGNLKFTESNLIQ